MQVAELVLGDRDFTAFPIFSIPANSSSERYALVASFSTISKSPKVFARSSLSASSGN